MRPFVAGVSKPERKWGPHRGPGVLSSNSHLNALRIHQLEQDPRRPRVREFVPVCDIPFMARIIIGLDVAKDTLEACVRPVDLRRSFPNTADGIADLVNWATLQTPERIVCESTGPYQKAAVAALLAAGLPAVTVNARQVRDFAKSLGQLAKTDRLDAAVIAHFGDVVPTIVRPLPPAELLELQGLFDRRGQLVRMLATEKNHRHAATLTAPRLLKTIDRHIAFLERQIKDLEDRMDRLVESSEAFREQNTLLQSITGIGPHVARTLIAYLPELGQRTRQAIAALVGLAPSTTTAAGTPDTVTSAVDATRSASVSIRPPSAPSAIARG